MAWQSSRTGYESSREPFADLDLDAIEARANAHPDALWIPAEPMDGGPYHDETNGTYVKAWVRNSPVGSGFLVSVSKSQSVNVPALIAALHEARAEVERLASVVTSLTALVEAKSSWIDGARIDIDGLEAERDDWRRRYEALRDGVTGLCEQADRSHDEYLRGLILDRFIVPSNVTVSRIRAVVARVEES